MNQKLREALPKACIIENIKVMKKNNLFQDKGDKNHIETRYNIDSR